MSRGPRALYMYHSSLCPIPLRTSKQSTKHLSKTSSQSLLQQNLRCQNRTQIVTDTISNTMVRDLQREYNSAQDGFRRANRRYDQLVREAPGRWRELSNLADEAEFGEGAFLNC